MPGALYHIANMPTPASASPSRMTPKMSNPVLRANLLPVPQNIMAAPAITNGMPEQR